MSPQHSSVDLIEQDVLTQAPQRFILAADCTVPSETSWENLKAAIDTAHNRG